MLIAIVGSDGAGKSTVGSQLLTWLQTQGPAELCHLGKQSGNLARSVARLPLMGKKLNHTIRKKEEKALSTRGPGIPEALVIYAFTLRRLFRFMRMQRLRNKGITILADRFPQISVPDAIDGPGFGRLRKDHALARILAGIEDRQFRWMTRHAPDLVLRLNVDADTAIARKPDHSPDSLARKIDGISRITFGTAPIVEIDATRPLEDVVDAAKTAISRAMARQN
ncbi:nucleoside triphosphate hydrolase [Acetobacter sp. AN02]|uniref:nucleoside triphosphate hydrolase n=1 Tax=Acetobacter sp. AN02 TaxID=2894186 RepID=UPI0024344E28|nr:nucleoside triphosphate hydrolase [Acetobacter sp. AN02]MDG6094845.1 nucleoside triphosphate hydrolase [Acetobacter sp. AN02]